MHVAKEHSSNIQDDIFEPQDAEGKETEQVEEELEKSYSKCNVCKEELIESNMLKGHIGNKRYALFCPMEKSKRLGPAKGGCTAPAPTGG